mgnify:CR=1 FL=1
MAKIVLGIGSSHTPTIMTPPERWVDLAEQQKASRVLLSHRKDGSVVPYQVLLEEAGDRFDGMVGLEQFREKHQRMNAAVAELNRTLKEARPDVVVVFSDDQDEILFEDNMPTFCIYWGETFHQRYHRTQDGGEELEMDVPCDPVLGKHMIEFLVEREFDVSHMRYMKEAYGGSIGPAGYVGWKRETPVRPRGIGHGFTYVVSKLMDNKPVPIVPIMQNTCYPPNQPTPRRSFSLGRAVRDAIEAWDNDKRVAVIGSGGLSHFVLNEELDRLVLQGMKEKNAELLCSLPRQQLQSASSEILNWVATAGAADHLDMEILDYVPTPRTLAGTGGGWGFARWT